MHYFPQTILHEDYTIRFYRELATYAQDFSPLEARKTLKDGTKTSYVQREYESAEELIQRAMGNGD